MLPNKIQQLLPRAHALYQGHQKALFASGAVCGVASAAAWGWSQWGTPEKVAATVSSGAWRHFRRTEDLPSGLKVYHAVPSAVFPEELKGLASRSSGGDLFKDWDVARWFEVMGSALMRVIDNPLLKTKASMCAKLLQEIHLLESPSEQIEQLRALYPASLELDVAVDEVFDKHMHTHGQIPSELLQLHLYASRPVSCNPAVRMFVAWVSSFPGSMIDLLECLENRISVETCVMRLGLLPSQEPLIVQAHALFQSWHPRIRAYVLEQALAQSIETIRVASEESVPESHPWNIYQRTLREHMLLPLMRDGHIPKDMLEQVLGVFLETPAAMQAKLLLVALRHPGRLSTNPLEQATFACELLSHGGIVAVKLGQIMSEMPQVPLLYRSLLGHLRHNSNPMSVGVFWSQIPESTRKHIASMGPLLGAGSVKQVHKAWLRKADRECAVAVLRAGVKEDAIENFAALQHNPSYASLAASLASVVYRELNVMEEAESLADFASTSIGQHRLFKVVHVLHADPSCLIETMAKGPTVAKALSGGSGWTDEAREEVKHVLGLYHETILQALIKEGVVHSDCHLGNANVVEVEQPEKYGFVLYDTGQVQRLSQTQVRAVVFLLSALMATDDATGAVLKKMAVDAMAPLCREYNSETSVAVKKSILSSLEKALLLCEKGKEKDINAMYLQCMRSIDEEGWHVPKGVFATAKMLDALQSQQITYGLPDVLTKILTCYMQTQLSWTDMARLGMAFAAGKAGFK